MFGIKKHHAAPVADEQIIDEILTRSVAAVLPSKDALKKRLCDGRRLKIYIGADATGPELHLGHATNFMLLEKLRELGHEVVILFGDFTAMVGDPTDKDAARVALSEEDVRGHIKSWKAQVAKLLSFTDAKNPARIEKNSTWLKRLGFKDVIDIASNFTVGHMIERDMFERRMKEGKPIYMHEFLYPLMQGYDSVAMNVDVEIGGTDQTFNMLAGRILQKRYHDKEKFIITTTLLENPKTGKKLMSKSEGNYISLALSASDMYGKVMALPDEVLIQMFVDCTRVSLRDIENIKKTLREGVNPRDIKMRLAREITTIYHGTEQAARAEKGFIETFREGSVPEDAVETAVPRGSELYAATKDVVRSKGELRRLVESGAVSEADGKKIDDVNFKIEHDMTLKIGKRRFVKVVVR